MSLITARLTGPNFEGTFCNDWDVCESNGWLHIESLEGWYGGVFGEIVPNARRAGSHGNVSARSFRSYRTIDLGLSWFNHSGSSEEYRRFARYASSLAWDHGVYRFSVIEDGFTLWCDTVLDGAISFKPFDVSSTDGFRVRVPLRSVDPFLYGEPTVTDARLAAGGFEATVSNNGTAVSYPTVRVSGNFPGGFSVSMNGKSVVWPHAVVSDGEPLDIDMRGFVWRDGSNLSYKATSRGFTGVSPGKSSKVTVKPVSGGSGTVSVFSWDTYI